MPGDLSPREHIEITQLGSRHWIWHCGLCHVGVSGVSKRSITAQAEQHARSTLHIEKGRP